MKNTNDTIIILSSSTEKKLKPTRQRQIVNHVTWRGGGDLFTRRLLRQGVPDASEQRHQDKTNWRHQARRGAQVQRVFLVQDEYENADDDEDGVVYVAMILVQDDRWRPRHVERRHLGLAECQRAERFYSDRHQISIFTYLYIIIIISYWLEAVDLRFSYTVISLNLFQMQIW